MYKNAITLSFLIIGLLFALFTSPSYANSTPWFTTDEAKVRLIIGGIEGNNNQPGTARLGLHYQLQPGWKIYWRTAGDSGTPTEISLEDAKNITDLAILWPTPTRLIDQFGDNFSIQSFIYKDEVVLPITATVSDISQPTHAVLKLNFAICKDICIPYQTSFTIDIPTNHIDIENMDLINTYLEKVPTIDTTGSALTFSDDYEVIRTPDNKQYLHVKATIPAFEKNTDILVEGPENVRFTTPLIHYAADTQSADFYIPIEISVPTIDYTGQKLRLTLVNGEKAIEKEFVADVAVEGTLPDAGNSMPSNVWLMLLYGLLGGLILNIMPCVLPVISIKLLSIIKHGGKHKRDATFSLLAAASGIIVSFMAIALFMIILKNAGHLIGWGIQFQHPSFIIALIIIVVLFASNLFGHFEISLPYWLGGKISTISTSTHQSSLAGHFITGVFATLLATPCTAPFLGVAVSFALSRGSSEISMIFFAMGTGMALPYLFFAFFPHLITWLPKPGNWMIGVKKFLGFLLLLTAFWLLGVLFGQIGVLPSIIIGLLCVLMNFWLQQSKGVLGQPRVKWVLVILTIVVAFFMPRQMVTEDTIQQSKAQKIWQTFDEKKIPALVAEGKTVFVDVTADWCTTCKINEFFVLNRDGAMEALSASNVIAMKADITNPNPSITDYMKRRNQYGIPYNVVYGPSAPDGINLPTLLTTNIVLEGLEKAK